MNEQQAPQPTKQVTAPSTTAKKPYATPLLKKHGHAQDITLQTFFGSFSPPSSD